MTLIKLYQTNFYIVHKILFFSELNVKQAKVGIDT